MNKELIREKLSNTIDSIEELKTILVSSRCYALSLLVLLQMVDLVVLLVARRSARCSAGVVHDRSPSRVA